MNALASREDDVCVAQASSLDTSLRALTTTNRYRTVSYCRGVRKIVRFGQAPAEVELGLLDDIRRRLSRQDIIPIIRRPTHGEVVRISHGPLAGVEGIFDSCLSGKERVVVLLRALSYQSRAVLKLSDIERFSEAV